MAATGWQFRAYDLGTGAALGTIEMSDWSHSDVLDDSGQWSATMIGRTAAVRRDYMGATTPGKAVIVPVRNGQPLGFAGIVWSRDPPKIAGAGLLSYFDRQPLNTRKAYVATDQHLVVKDMVDWVQANGGNIQVDTSQVGPSYVLRDQTWERWEEKSIGDAIRQKGDNIGGFDFDVRVEYDAGVLTRRLRLWTPRRGRYWQGPQTNVSFRLDGRHGNVRSVPSASVDATKLSTHVYAKGQEINSTTHERLISESVRTDLIAAGWPRLGEVQDLADVKDLTTLQSHADGLAYLYGPTSVDEIVLDVNPDHEPWSVGTWDLGDDCRVSLPGPRQTSTTSSEFAVVDGDGSRIDVGTGDTVAGMTEVIVYSVEGTLPWWPDGFNEIRRVTEHRWTFSAQDGERFQVVTRRILG